MKDKRPSFQWYPKDYMSDINVISMTPEQEGHYRRLLDICWMEGSLPLDVPSILALLKHTSSLDESYLQPVLKCFYVKGEKMHHKRLDFEREKQDIYKRRSAAGGRESQRRRALLKGTQIKQEAKGNTASSFASSTSSPKDKKNSRFSFEKLWKIYPLKDGKKMSAKYFKATVQTIKDYEDISIALEKYKKSVKDRPRAWKNGATFFNNWKDWVDWQEPDNPESNGSGPGLQIGINGDEFDPKTETDPALLEGDKYG